MPRILSTFISYHLHAYHFNDRTSSSRFSEVKISLDQAWLIFLNINFYFFGLSHTYISFKTTNIWVLINLRLNPDFFFTDKNHFDKLQT